jgi:hypothetical protein
MNVDLAAHSHWYHHRGFPSFGEFAEILDDVIVEIIPLHYTTREVSPDLGEFAEIIGAVSVKMI